MKRKNLGRGLDSLIPKNINGEDTGHSSLSIELLQPNESQPRKHFSEESLIELADSIKESGIIQPIIVRKKGARYEIVVGERRWRAAKMASLEKVPVIVRTISDLKVAEITLVENIQRENLNPIEEAEAYEKLIRDFNLTHEEISKKTGKNRSTVTNQLRLLNLSEKSKQALASGKITSGHARALLATRSPEEMDSLLAEVFRKDLTVRKTEALVKKLNKEPVLYPLADTQREQDIFTRELVQRLSGKFSTKVIINGGEKKGKIEIQYYSPEELDRIVGILLSRG